MGIDSAKTVKQCPNTIICRRGTSQPVNLREPVKNHCERLRLSKDGKFYNFLDDNDDDDVEDGD